MRHSHGLRHLTEHVISRSLSAIAAVTPCRFRTGGRMLCSSSRAHAGCGMRWHWRSVRVILFVGTRLPHFRSLSLLVAALRDRLESGYMPLCALGPAYAWCRACLGLEPSHSLHRRDPVDGQD